MKHIVNIYFTGRQFPMSFTCSKDELDIVLGSIDRGFFELNGKWVNLTKMDYLEWV